MTAHRLGGNGGGGRMTRPLDREERLQRLLDSRLFCTGSEGQGEEATKAAQPQSANPFPSVRSSEASGDGAKPPPVPSSRLRGSASSSGQHCRPSTGGAARPTPSTSASDLSGKGSGKRPSQKKPEAHFGAKIRTLSSERSTGSRLHNTTEAYRQQHGTTAKTVDAVGRDTMTPEKSREVQQARKKVLGSDSQGGEGRPSSGKVFSTPARSTSSTAAAAKQSAGPPKKPPMPAGPGHRLGSA
mmetsp:Transcript_63210/g.137880  ORF Transcript_63210/g.137880 Transcript_63210/m.137880 type:complete len:242 (+) Transcript_63210:135-860(+)